MDREKWGWLVAAVFAVIAAVAVTLLLTRGPASQPVKRTVSCASAQPNVCKSKGDAAVAAACAENGVSSVELTMMENQYDDSGQRVLNSTPIVDTRSC
jgi:hypothetical protein